jgi:hypothetical protein
MPYGSGKENPFSTIPSKTKGALTRMFNKKHEDAKLKLQQQKGKSKGTEHVKFNPVL